MTAARLSISSCFNCKDSEVKERQNYNNNPTLARVTSPTTKRVPLHQALLCCVHISPVAEPAPGLRQTAGLTPAPGGEVGLRPRSGSPDSVPPFARGCNGHYVVVPAS